MYAVSPASSSARSVSSYNVAGATQTPGAAVPKPSRDSCERNACRRSRIDSGTEKTTTSQPSAAVARGCDQIRRSPSRNTASDPGDNAYPACPPRDAGSSTPRRFSRDTDDRTAGESTPRSDISAINDATESQLPSSRA